MRCAVCLQPMSPEQARYANAWERSLKQHPCCSESCCGKFDANTHWYPLELPPALDDEAAGKLMEVGKSRIRKGDGPGFVARDLLLTGMPPWMVRRTLLGAAAAAVSSDGRTGGWNLLNTLTFGILGQGVFVHDRNRGLTDATDTLDGAAQVDAWEQHFALTSTR